MKGHPAPRRHLELFEVPCISKKAHQKKSAAPMKGTALSNKTLAVTYFRMGRPHTIIGDAPFHF